jgi:predicted nucleic acid-binding protein
MPERWVVNASPLIVLAKIDRLDLLIHLADELLIPVAAQGFIHTAVFGSK